MSRKMMLLAAIAAVVLSVATLALASCRIPNDCGKGTLGKANSAKNKDLPGWSR